MQFSQLLDTLARSSAQAVTTLGQGQKEQDELKSYLYVETEIEKDFRRLLDSNLTSDTVIFLCGSSGDGKSEILKRYHETYSKRVRFHLDATHAFKPDQDAIEALDQLFDEHSESDKPLVVGINVGMLFNFASQGHLRHENIRSAIESYLQSGEETSNSYKFLNFEQYPKFSIEEGKTGSSFISELIARVVATTENNPLHLAYLDAVRTSPSKLTLNYELLKHEQVRDRIVHLLLSARLKFDQFLSARALLDFVHHLVCGPCLLFNNLFVAGHNDLSDIISHFDPCTIRSRSIDQFLIQHPLGIREATFDDFQNSVQETFGIADIESAGWLRFFYLFQDVAIGNDFHKKFKNDFEQPLYDRYIEIWRLHKTYNGTSEERQKLRAFYKGELVSALVRFGNRLDPSLTAKQHLFLCSRNGVFVSAVADIKPDLKRIESEEMANNIHEFPVCLKVGDEPLKTFNVNLSFLELVSKINDGYRPNKHDKNTIVILEEIVDDVIKAIIRSKKLMLSDGRKHVYLTNEIEDSEIVVGGVE
ncbi:DNA phosphorothioation-dependent restriction protein DptF [Halomonas sp. 15WGF]|uniref:DNA phosphorothioation-dependent restriction protein DptF n=1 Tax=Halomonas sp. 15WGF TaxID=2570357 RepID=UPI0010BE44CE|nr:DNA phosphorothioation-dependent restriction protein DptF [Halomonas sp. 15WGF]TKJ09902.1 DNA phosphorothioation-dependent restriction protein DptF [Halomonas sp. 15WGF]